MFYADCRGHDLHNLRKTARSPTTVTACHLLNSLRDPMLLKGKRRRTVDGADGWQPNSPRNSIWQGKPACCLGRPGVQPRLPGFSCRKRPQECHHISRQYRRIRNNWGAFSSLLILNLHDGVCRTFNAPFCKHVPQSRASNTIAPKIITQLLIGNKIENNRPA